MNLLKYSFGVGDRFGCQGCAQLAAFVEAKKLGINITPVWNKSNREHSIIHTCPADVREEAEKAVLELNWNGAYFVDADHINLSCVDNFIDSCNFFTLDVADYIGEKADEARIDEFVEKYDFVLKTFPASIQQIKIIAAKYFYAVEKAGKIYRHIKENCKSEFIIEVSMDETESPQTPIELLFILAMIADEKIPAQTIAPKFSGRFNKGVDYVGDLKQFEKEFENDVKVIQFAIENFGLNENLKLSIHSGSDKFAIYPLINKIIKKYDVGIHVKTAGTTWLEELIGLAEAGGEALSIAKEIYKKAYERYEELATPYAAVIDINREDLPKPFEVNSWNSMQFAEALRHDSSNKNYNINFRQLLHVGYKIAAELGNKYIDIINSNKEIVGKNVTKNIFDRHIKAIFSP